MTKHFIVKNLKEGANITFTYFDASYHLVINHSVEAQCG